jgi:hypothetical protein
MADQGYDEAAIRAEVTRHVEAGLGEEAILPRERFCQLWQPAREGLAVLRSIAPATVRAIIGVVMVAGDAAAGQLCGAGRG